MTSTASIESFEALPSIRTLEAKTQFDVDLLRSIQEAEPQIDQDSGLKVVRLEVKDGSEDYPGRREFDQMATQFQDLLSTHPEFEAPGRPRDEAGKTLDVIPRNPVSEALYAEPEAVRWGTLMPDSYALWNLYHPDEETLPDGTHVTDRMKMVFNHLLDARGIRIRGKLITALGINQALKKDTGDTFSWISHGGGAFAPAMHAAETLHDLTPDKPLHVEVYDLDEDAMKFGQEQAEKRGLTENAAFETHVANFRNDFLSGRSEAVQRAVEMGGADYVENSGLTEYFNDRISTMLVKNGYESTAPGGTFVFSNMRDDREQLDLNQRGVGWNKMFVRSLSELRDLLDMAGIDSETATVYQPQDGLYSIVEIRKPVEYPERSAITELGRLGNQASARAA